MSAPDGFVKVSDAPCDCARLWREPDGSRWCCGEKRGISVVSQFQVVPGSTARGAVCPLRVMPKVNLHLGNVVKLRSGGPAMTVEREPDKTEDVVHCVWSDSGHIRRDKFPRRTLDKVKT